MFAVEKLPSPTLSEEPVKAEDVDEYCSDKVGQQQVNFLVCSSFPHIGEIIMEMVGRAQFAYAGLCKEWLRRYFDLCHLLLPILDCNVD